MSPLSGLERDGLELLPGRGREIGRDRAFQSCSLSQSGSYSGRGTEAEIVPRGPWDRKNSIPIEGLKGPLPTIAFFNFFEPGLKISIPIEIFNPGLKFSISIENFNPGLKFSISIEFFNPGSKACQHTSKAEVVALMHHYFWKKYIYIFFIYRGVHKREGTLWGAIPPPPKKNCLSKSLLSGLLTSLGYTNNLYI